MRKSGGRFGRWSYALVSKKARQIVRLSEPLDFESAMLTRKKL
jgi:hypothetical protein